jgi:hypothetical protein
MEQRFAETHQRIWQAAFAAVLATATLVGFLLRFLHEPTLAERGKG